MISGMTADLLLDVLLLTSILGLGALVAYCLLGEWATPRIASLAFPIGSGVLTWLIFLVSWAGLRLNAAVLTLVLAGAYAVCLGIVWRRGRSPGRRPEAVVGSGDDPSERSPRILVWLIGVTGLIIVVANLLIAVSSSYSLWDSIAIWSLQGYGIAHAGSVFGAAEGAHGLAYPMNIPLQVALFTLAGGDTLPGSKGVFPLYFLSLLVGVFVFSRSHGMDRAKAGLGTLGLATLPALFTESTSGYANAPMVVYLALGGMALLDGALRSSRRELLLGGLLLGFAGWTRVEGILYSGAVLLACFAVVAATRRPGIGWAWALVPIAVVLLPWFVFYRLNGSSGSQAMDSLSAALAALLTGQFHLGALRLVLLHAANALWDTGAWGWVWALAAFVAVLAFRAAPRAERIGFGAFAAMSLGTALVTILIFYLGSFGVGDLRGWLGRSFDRAYLVTPVLLLIGAIQLLVPSPSAAQGGPGDPGRFRKA
jgi:hypothetical protein